MTPELQDVIAKLKKAILDMGFHVPDFKNPSKDAEEIIFTTRQQIVVNRFNALVKQLQREDKRCPSSITSA